LAEKKKKKIFINPLMPVPAVSGCTEDWLAFVPLLTSSPLTKFGITYTQVFQQEKIFPMIPRSERLGQICA